MEGVAEWVSETRLLEIDNVLKNVISKGILHKMEGAVGDLANELGFLVACSVVYATLQHATTVAMGSNGYAICANSIKDELLLVNHVILGNEG